MIRCDKGASRQRMILPQVCTNPTLAQRMALQFIPGRKLRQNLRAVFCAEKEPQRTALLADIPDHLGGIPLPDGQINPGKVNLLRSPCSRFGHKGIALGRNGKLLPAGSLPQISLFQKAILLADLLRIANKFGSILRQGNTAVGACKNGYPGFLLDLVDRIAQRRL